MKNWIIILLFMQIALSAYCFDEPVEIDTELQGNLVIDLEENMKQVNGNLWILYYDISEFPESSRLKLARETDSSSIEVLTLDEFYVEGINQIKFSCCFDVIDNNVNIFYKKPDDSGEMSVYQIHSEDMLESWNELNSVSVYEDTRYMSIENIDGDQYLVLVQFGYIGNGMFHELYYEKNCGLEFTGDDEFSGSIYSKDDILVRNNGEGSNNGWPLFHEMVTAEGNFIDAETGENLAMSAPMEEIFPGGWEEIEPNEEIINSSLAYINNGFTFYESESRDLLYLKIEGSTATGRFGDIVNETDTLIVYNSFPTGNNTNITIGDSIWVNIIEKPEIDWDEDVFAITLEGYALKLFCDLWVEGTIGGNMSIGSREDIYITDDILYVNTEPGNLPGDNTKDSFLLHSGKNIYIKYKNYDPDIGVINNANCNNVMIYGFLSATGAIVPEEEHKAGCLRAEYIHPHGSSYGFDYITPEGEIMNIVYPDLHKFVYYDIDNFTGDSGFIMHSNAKPANFPCCGSPYEDPEYGDGITTPYGADFPWYNPVYPESSGSITFNRGDIDLYGGLYERRSHEVYCCGDDSTFHYNNIWDPENRKYGGDHAPCGYKLNIYHDPRLNEEGYFKGINDLISKTGYEITILKFADGEESFTEEYSEEWEDISVSSYQDLLTDNDNGKIAMIYVTDQNYRMSIYDIANFSLETRESAMFWGELHSLNFIDNAAYFLDRGMQYCWGESVDIELYFDARDYAGFTFLNNGEFFWILGMDEYMNYFSIYEKDDGELNSIWHNYFDEISVFNYENTKDLHFLFSENDLCNLLINTSDEDNEHLYLFQADLTSYTPVNEDALGSELSISFSPNPVYAGTGRSMLNANISLNREQAELTVYNIKGQRVLQQRISESGMIQILLPRLSSGLYFMRLRDSESEVCRKMLLIK